MLFTASGSTFATGKALFYDGPEETAKVFVRVAFSGLPGEFTAQLDTVAPWSVLSPDAAEALGLSFEGKVRTLSTRRGRFHGVLQRVPLTLLADEGTSIDIEATFFLSRDWQDGVFLGYGGMLEFIRFALDPPRNVVYFGHD